MAGREEEPGAGRCEEAAPAGGGQDGGTEEDPRHEARGGSIYSSHFHFCFLSYQLIFVIRRGHTLYK